MKLDRNITYYATRNEAGEIEELGERPDNIPYPICDVPFDAEGNALRTDVMLDNDEPFHVDEKLTAHFRDVIDNHPDCRAVRPIYANVTFSVIANAWPDDDTYLPVLNGVTGRKIHNEKRGHLVEFGTRPESVPESIPGMLFDVFGNVLKPGNDSNDTTTWLEIDTAMTARIRQYFIDTV